VELWQTSNVPGVGRDLNPRMSSKNMPKKSMDQRSDLFVLNNDPDPLRGGNVPILFVKKSTMRCCHRLKVSSARERKGDEFSILHRERPWYRSYLEDRTDDW
jgi:hypothetical protein